MFDPKELILPTAEWAREWLMQREDGVLCWRYNGRAAVKIHKKRGTTSIRIGRETWRGDQISWLLNTGWLPTESLRHIDGVKWYDRIENLEPASGLDWMTVHAGRWQAFHGSGAGRVWLGVHFSIEEAERAVEVHQRAEDLF